MTEIVFMEGNKYRPAGRDHKHKASDIEGVRDTGRLTFTSTFSQVTNGAIYFQRVGTLVFATFYDVDFGDITEFPSYFYLEGSIPEGFVPPSFTSFVAMSSADGVNTRRIRFQHDGRILIYSAEPGMRFNVTASWVTLQDWPET